jgi:O-6-methylguanine DNA methyltransferase
MWESPIGVLGLAATHQGLCRVKIGAEEAQFVQNLSRRYHCQPVKSAEYFNPIQKKFADYFKHHSRQINWPLDLRGATPFQLKVWKKMAAIPYGETRSYQWLAEQIGHPLAYRAVGQASSANPIPIIIPCHRVIKANGELGGFTAGSGIKRCLLELEGYPVS